MDGYIMSHVPYHQENKDYYFKLFDRDRTFSIEGWRVTELYNVIQLNSEDREVI